MAEHMAFRKKPSLPLPAGAAVALLLMLCTGAGWASASGLTCYKCTVLPPPQLSNETKRLCSHFDGSPLYQVHCPYSTFCLKRTFQLPLGKGQTVAGVERDCAPQRYRYQRYDEARGHWQTEDAVAEGAYAPGCLPESGEAARAVKSAAATYCYCQSHLCNGAASPRHGPAASARTHGPRPHPLAHHTDAMAVIFVFNAMKYIRSLR